MNGTFHNHLEDKIPITERSNKITEDIDKETEKIAKKLYQCDLEIFNGWEKHRNVLSPEIVGISRKISVFAAKYVQPDAHKTGIVLSGCGTSGRIAFLISRTFNKLAIEQNLRPCYKYIISGGDHALMTSVESCEDDWNAGKDALKKAAEGLDKVLFIGITCGLSAPFVGGQVEYSLQHSGRFTAYLLGFNLASQARRATIRGTDKVMFDIVLEMEVKHCLLNPIVGPEPINGSSRMKGATASKMLLEAIFLKAHQIANNDPNPIPYDDFIKTYKYTLDFTHTKEAEIFSLIKMAGYSLVRGGCISYVSWNSVGIMSMIDAAECVPTFGANHDDVRSFLGGGYEFLENTWGDLSSEGDPSPEGDKFQIALQYFKEKRCPRLSELDTVIFIVSNLSLEQKLELDRIAELVKFQKVQLALIAINTSGIDVKEIQDTLGNPLTISIVLPSIGRIESDNKYLKFVEQCNAEVCLKWVLNAVSTGAHIFKGKVYKNCMIDLKLTNKKLFERGIRIVVQFADVNKETARVCLLRSIYRTDKLSPPLLKADVSDHVQKAGKVEKVIPLAFLLTKGFMVDSGLKMLQDCPIVRQCIDKYI